MYCSSRRNQLTSPYLMNCDCGVMSSKGVFLMLVQYSRIQSPIDIIPFSLKSVAIGFIRKILRKFAVMQICRQTILGKYIWTQKKLIKNPLCVPHYYQHYWFWIHLHWIIIFHYQFLLYNYFHQNHDRF